MAAAGAEAAGANLLRRNFDEIFQPLTFAILMSTTTTQTRPIYGQFKFLLTSSFAVSLKPDWSARMILLEFCGG